MMNGREKAHKENRYRPMQNYRVPSLMNARNGRRNVFARHAIAIFHINYAIDVHIRYFSSLDQQRVVIWSDQRAREFHGLSCSPNSLHKLPAVLNAKFFSPFLFFSSPPPPPPRPCIRFVYKSRVSTERFYTGLYRVRYQRVSADKTDSFHFYISSRRTSCRTYRVIRAKDRDRDCVRRIPSPRSPKIYFSRVHWSSVSNRAEIVHVSRVRRVTSWGLHV